MAFSLRSVAAEFPGFTVSFAIVSSSMDDGSPSPRSSSCYGGGWKIDGQGVFEDAELFRAARANGTRGRPGPGTCRGSKQPTSRNRSSKSLSNTTSPKAERVYLTGHAIEAASDVRR
jgi:hypothetical protein